MRYWGFKGGLTAPLGLRRLTGSVSGTTETGDSSLEIAQFLDRLRRCVMGQFKFQPAPVKKPVDEEDEDG